jgi:hypothetical protein
MLDQSAGGTGKVLFGCYHVQHRRNRKDNHSENQKVEGYFPGHRGLPEKTIRFEMLFDFHGFLPSIFLRRRPLARMYLGWNSWTIMKPWLKKSNVYMYQYVTFGNRYRIARMIGDTTSFDPK